ncbi:hypothetical protein GCM10027341_30510 [Spirosoma knui]
MIVVALKQFVKVAYIRKAEFVGNLRNRQRGVPQSPGNQLELVSDDKLLNGITNLLLK